MVARLSGIITTSLSTGLYLCVRVRRLQSRGQLPPRHHIHRGDCQQGGGVRGAGRGAVSSDDADCWQ